jgi:UDP-N-acetylglucosamine 2-epimerase
MTKEPKRMKTSVSKKSAKRSGTNDKKVLRVPMHSVVHFVRMLHDEKHAAKFMKEARDSNAVVTLHPDTIKFVRDFVSNNQLHHSMATKVIDPCPDDPFECNFRD